MRKWLITVIVLLLTLGVAALIILNIEQRKIVPPIQGLKPVAVAIKPARQEQWQTQITATGTLEAEQSLMLKSAFNQGGVIMRIRFNSGDWVKKGQSLFDINPDASVIVRAPFDGRIGLKLVDVGEYVAPGTALAPLADTSKMRVSFTIPQANVADVQGGERVEVSVTAYPDQLFKGEITAIDTQLDINTRSLSVWATIPNLQNKLIPGMFADVILFTNDKKAVVVVPQTAVVFNQAGNYIYRVIEGKAVVTPVQLGMRYGDDIVITHGLKANESVVVAGIQKIYDGWPLRNATVDNSAVKEA